VRLTIVGAHQRRAGGNGRPRDCSCRPLDDSTWAPVSARPARRPPRARPRPARVRDEGRSRSHWARLPTAGPAGRGVERARRQCALLRSRRASAAGRAPGPRRPPWSPGRRPQVGVGDGAVLVDAHGGCAEVADVLENRAKGLTDDGRRGSDLGITPRAICRSRRPRSASPPRRSTTGSREPRGRPARISLNSDIGAVRCDNPVAALTGYPTGVLATYIGPKRPVGPLPTWAPSWGLALRGRPGRAARSRSTRLTSTLAEHRQHRGRSSAPSALRREAGHADLLADAAGVAMTPMPMRRCAMTSSSAVTDRP
jgi:hypothetical protein